jgi:hypothetical protein
MNEEEKAANIYLETMKMKGIPKAYEREFEVLRFASVQMVAHGLSDTATRESIEAYERAYLQAQVALARRIRGKTGLEQIRDAAPQTHQPTDWERYIRALEEHFGYLESPNGGNWHEQ